MWNAERYGILYYQWERKPHKTIRRQNTINFQDKEVPTLSKKKRSGVVSARQAPKPSSIKMTSMQKNPWTVTRRLIAMVFVIFLVFGYIQLRDIKKADSTALAALNSTDTVTATRGDGAYTFTPIPESKVGFIFYPASRVEYKSYAPLMQRLAQQGIFCVMTEMPLNLSSLDRSAASIYLKQYPEITTWFVGGHTLGGKTAASYAAKNLDRISGLVLLSAYSGRDLTKSDLPVLSIIGDQDGVLDRSRYESGLKRLPDTAQIEVIQGGNHAGFGSYGEEEKDGTATISEEEQWDKTAQLIADFIHAVAK